MSRESLSWMVCGWGSLRRRRFSRISIGVEGLRDTRSTVLSDTSEKVREVYFQRLRGMTASERLELGAALWSAGDSLQRAALQRDNRYADEAEITFRIAASRFGLEVARKAYRKL